MTDQLSEGYRKARKLYGLFAALLLGWEIVGIGLPEGGAVDTAVGKWTITNPDAMPWVLMVLVVYAGFRFGIEQRLTAGLESRAARLDYLLAHIIGLLSLGIWGVQTATDLNLFDEYEHHSPEYFVSFAVGLALSAQILTRFRPGKSGDRGSLVDTAVIVVFGVVMFFVTPKPDFYVAVVIGAVGGIALYAWGMRMEEKYGPKSSTDSEEPGRKPTPPD